MFNKSINTTTTLYLTVFYPLLYIPFTVHIRVYVLHSRPTDFHSSTRLNSGPHSAELVQSTKTTTDPSRIFFSCSTHHLTSPPPSPHHHHCHHHCHSHAFLWLFHSLSLTEPPLLHKPPRGSSISFSLYLSRRHSLRRTHTLLPYTSGAEISMYYLPVTRNPYPQPYRFKPSKKMWWWCSSKMVR